MVEVSKIRTKMCEIWFDDEGILILKPSDNAGIDLEEVTACFDAYKELGIGPHNKVLEIIDQWDGSITTEARNYAAEVGSDFFIASAVISNSLAVRLVVNFFNAFYKTDVPFKMFANEEQAKKWLRTFRI